MSKLNISRLTNENEDGAPKISGITTFSTTAFLEVPKGTTAQRPEFVQPGMIRFNTDGAHLEYYNGVEWTEVLVANNSLDGGARGIFMGGYFGTGAGENSNVIDYITISSLGNAIDFGDLITARGQAQSCSSSTRGLYANGRAYPGASSNAIEFITFSSTGNSTNFGSTSTASTGKASCSSETRGIFTLGNSSQNTIEYVTISATGNSIDFGDLSVARAGEQSCASSTRGIFASGLTSPSPVTLTNIIDYITISTTGNATTFGNLAVHNNKNSSGCSNSTRGLFAGGDNPAPYTNTIQYITIATTGNSVDFGDLTQARAYLSACSSSTRATIGGGYNNSIVNTIDYVSISTTGNALDFGDVSSTRYANTACSNGHGGL